eukprot:EC715432.1.p2 GENE.EC715432.1~~EC715432.1.p2  ORF type:complete len:144 (+),score=55.38 EC715432.1:29-433(+)
MAAQVRLGGKGSVRRKMKAAHRVQAADDKKLEATLKKMNVQTINAIEEVNMFKEDGSVIHFQAPKVRANISSNTFVVGGTAEHKRLQELLPGIMSQLGPESINSLKSILASLKPGSLGPEADEGIPDLVENADA